MSSPPNTTTNLILTTTTTTTSSPNNDMKNAIQRDMLRKASKASFLFWAGVQAGALSTYSTLVTLGHAPLFLIPGPDRREWSDEGWTKQATKLIHEYNNKPGWILHKLMSSTRNFIAADPDSRRHPRKIMFFSPYENKGFGVVRWGLPYKENPPLYVHRGSATAFADQILGALCFRINWFPCLTASLVVDYMERIPLGSTCGFECFIEEGATFRKLTTHYRCFSLLDYELTYMTATGVFVNSMLATRIGKALL
jgi:hypothetical protein